MLLTHSILINHQLLYNEHLPASTSRSHGTECLNPELDSALRVLAACSQHRQAWGVIWAQPTNHTPKYFGEAMLEPSGSAHPCRGTKGEKALAKGNFWWGALRQQLLARLQHWGAEVAPSQQVPNTRLQCLPCKCSAHTRSISVIYLIFFFTLLKLFFCSKHLPTIRPTVQNWRSD